jgi:hypothetical protein
MRVFSMDPEGMKNVKDLLGDKISYGDNQY